MQDKPVEVQPEPVADTGSQLMRNEMSCGGKPIISGFIPDTFYMPANEVASNLRGTSFNTAATLVAWSVIEKTQGTVDLGPYFERFDALVDSGLCLIILIDTSGRIMRTDLVSRYVDKNSIPRTSLPDWLPSTSLAETFYGDRSSSLDFDDDFAKARVESLYVTLVAQLKARYGEKIVAMAPCFTTECEIKYTQEGYRWQNYSEKSRQAFAAWLSARGKVPARMPTIDYGSFLGTGNPRVQTLYPDLQAYREDSIAKYACNLSNIIRSASVRPMGYFGQVFAFTDAIFATGAIEKVVGCFDAIGIDYNYYNGYAVELRPEIPAFIASYAGRLGFKSVIIGLYAERFRNPTTLALDPTAYRMIEESLRTVEPSKYIAGTEIGNLTPKEYATMPKVDEIVQAMNVVSTKESTGKKIAVYASFANFYLWNGDFSNNRQILQDNLISTYRRLKAKGHQVDVIGDAEMSMLATDNLKNYALLVVPHVSAMPAGAKSKIKQYFEGGGSIFIDMGFDSYLPDGSIQTDRALAVSLGIGAQQGYGADKTWLSRDGSRSIKIQKTEYYSTQFAYAAMPGFSIAYKLVGGGGEGIVLQGPRSTVMGFLPLFLGGEENKAWGNSVFDSEVARLLQ